MSEALPVEALGSHGGYLITLQPACYEEANLHGDCDTKVFSQWPQLSRTFVCSQPRPQTGEQKSLHISLVAPAFESSQMRSQT